jgi:hypothetical protein
VLVIFIRRLGFGTERPSAMVCGVGAVVGGKATIDHNQLIWMKETFDFCPSAPS